MTLIHYVVFLQGGKQRYGERTPPAFCRIQSTETVVEGTLHQKVVNEIVMDIIKIRWWERNNIGGHGA